jgi:hypothetical protein
MRHGQQLAVEIAAQGEPILPSAADRIVHRQRQARPLYRLPSCPQEARRRRCPADATATAFSFQRRDIVFDIALNFENP